MTGEMIISPPQVPAKDVLAGLQLIGVMCCQLAQVTGPITQSLAVIQCAKFLGQHGFLVNIYQHEDMKGHRLAMIESPVFGIPKMWARKFVFHAGMGGDFAHIGCHIDGADMIFVAGKR